MLLALEPCLVLSWCQPWCSESCCDLNGNVVQECGTCSGPMRCIPKSPCFEARKGAESPTAMYARVDTSPQADPPPSPPAWEAIAFAADDSNEQVQASFREPAGVAHDPAWRAAESAPVMQYARKREPLTCDELMRNSSARHEFAECLELHGDYRGAWEVWTSLSSGSPTEMFKSVLTRMLFPTVLDPAAASVPPAAHLARMVRSHPFAAVIGSVVMSIGCKVGCTVLGLLILLVGFAFGARAVSWRVHVVLLPLAHWYMDLLMGVIHMTLDSPSLLHYPALGTFTTAFQHHHVTLIYKMSWPQYIFEYGTEVLVVMHSVPFLAAVHVLRTSAPVRGAAWTWSAHMVWTSYLSLVAHRCCHGDPSGVPWAIRAAQDMGLLLSREKHRIHHRTFAVSSGALHLTTFYAGGHGYGWSFYNAWAAPVLDWLSLRIHYSDPRVLALTFGFVTHLPLLLLAVHATLSCIGGAVARAWHRRRTEGHERGRGTQGWPFLGKKSL